MTSGTMTRTDEPVQSLGVHVTCRCGCGSPIAHTRTFLNKDHQVAWLRAEAARRRSARPPADTEPAEIAPVVVAKTEPAREPEPEREAEPHPEPETLSLAGEIYVVGSVVTALPVFFGIWLFCLAAFGLPLGGGLGWLPAAAVAVLAGLAWPAMLIGSVLLVAMLM
jgi:hypothetical protein